MIVLTLFQCPKEPNVAVGKKGEAGAPAVRKVMADNENNVVENIVMDGGVSQSSDPSKDVMAKGEVYKGYQSKDEGAENFKGYQSAADAPDRFAAQPKDVPIPPVGKKSIDLTQLDSILKTKASPVGADTCIERARNTVCNDSVSSKKSFLGANA